MKVLVTGATGFIGRHLTQTLCSRGYTVRVLARPSSKTDFLKSLKVEIISGNITDFNAVKKAVVGCQHVYHLAGKTSRVARIKNTEESHSSLYAVNMGGTKNVALAASAAKVERLVYGSSAGVYGVIKHLPADENSPTNPNTLYRQSKLLGEKILLSSHQQTGLPVVIARLSSVFGAEGLNYLGFCGAISTGQFRLIGRGHNYLHLTHVSDTVDGLIKCATAPNIEGNCYLIAGQEPIQLSYFVGAIAKELGVKLAAKNSPELPFKLFFALSQIMRNISGIELPRSHQYEMFVTSRILNIAKAQKELNYQPSRSFEQGIQETIQWYREQGMLGFVK